MAGIITFSRYLLVAAIMAGGTAYMLPAMAAEGGGYDGLIAPAAPDNAPDSTAAGTDNDSSGVVASPTAEQPQTYTRAPGASKPIHDLRVMSLIHGNDPDGTGVPSGLKGPQVDFSATTHKVVEGKPAMEYMTEKRIEGAMASINDKNISPDQRDENARAAYKNLSTLADGLRYKQTIPDRVYKQMQLSDSYISDEHAGNAAALSQLDAALATLKPYQ